MAQLIRDIGNAAMSFAQQISAGEKTDTEVIAGYAMNFTAVPENIVDRHRGAKQADPAGNSQGQTTDDQYAVYAFFPDRLKQNIIIRMGGKHLQQTIENPDRDIAFLCKFRYSVHNQTEMFVRTVKHIAHHDGQTNRSLLLPLHLYISPGTNPAFDDALGLQFI